METNAKWRILSSEHNLQQKPPEDHKIREGTCAGISFKDTAGLEPVVNISTLQGPN